MATRALEALVVFGHRGALGLGAQRAFLCEDHQGPWWPLVLFLEGPGEEHWLLGGAGRSTVGKAGKLPTPSVIGPPHSQCSGLGAEIWGPEIPGTPLGAAPVA